MTAQSIRSDRGTLSAFGALVVLVGANVVAIRFSNRELAPFWGAGTRFALAAILFMAILVARRIALPRGTALAGALLFGVLDIAAFFALSYWGLVRVPAGQGAVVGALLPLVTLFLAVAHGLERLGWRAVAGAILAVVGVAVVSGEQVRGEVPLVSLLALVAAVVCGAEATIVVKWFPPTNPAATNAVATTVGAVVLLALSVISGESRAPAPSGRHLGRHRIPRLDRDGRGVPALPVRPQALAGIGGRVPLRHVALRIRGPRGGALGRGGDATLRRRCRPRPGRCLRRHAGPCVWRRRPVILQGWLDMTARQIAGWGSDG
jgi:hypothetical protein